MVPEPPADPDSWSDEQWIDWLATVDAEVAADRAPVRSSWRTSPAGTALYGAMGALHGLIYGEHQVKIEMVVEAPGGPPDPEPLEVHLEPEHPEDSTVVVRRWMIDGTPEPEA